jgi:hypothetical protein
MERLFSAVLASIAIAALCGEQTIAQSSAAAAPEPPQSISSQPTPDTPKAPITVLEDTLLRVMTNEPVSSKRTHDGDQVRFTVSEDVITNDGLAIPRGATVYGVVVKAKKAGRLTGSPELIFKLTSLDLGGRSYPLYTYEFKVTGASKTKPTEKKVAGGAAAGAAFGVAVDASADKSGVANAGAAEATVVAVTTGVGAGAGVGVGTAVSAVSPGPVLSIPAESQLDFHLASPITVTPLSAREAARLSEGLCPGGPTLYVRDENP